MGRIPTADLCVTTFTILGLLTAAGCGRAGGIGETRAAQGMASDSDATYHATAATGGATAVTTSDSAAGGGQVSFEAAVAAVEAILAAKRGLCHPDPVAGPEAELGFRDCLRAHADSLRRLDEREVLLVDACLLPQPARPLPPPPPPGMAGPQPIGPDQLPRPNPADLSPALRTRLAAKLGSTACISAMAAEAGASAAGSADNR